MKKTQGIQYIHIQFRSRGIMSSVCSGRQLPVVATTFTSFTETTMGLVRLERAAKKYCSKYQDLHRLINYVLCVDYFLCYFWICFGRHSWWYICISIYIYGVVYVFVVFSKGGVWNRAFISFRIQLFPRLLLPIDNAQPEQKKLKNRNRMVAGFQNIEGESTVH